MKLQRARQLNIRNSTITTTTTTTTTNTTTTTTTINVIVTTKTALMLLFKKALNLCINVSTTCCLMFLRTVESK